MKHSKVIMALNHCATICSAGSLANFANTLCLYLEPQCGLGALSSCPNHALTHSDSDIVLDCARTYLRVVCIDFATALAPNTLTSLACANATVKTLHYNDKNLSNEDETFATAVAGAHDCTDVPS